MPGLRLSARGIRKRFPGVLALDGVDLDVRAGEVLAVVGENGAGKSTLMRVLAGVEAPDGGSVEVDGRPVPTGSVRAARAAGVALIHQELVLAGNLDVASNVFLGREPRRGPFVDRARLRADAAAIVARLGLDVDVRTRVERLPLGRRQLVEIARALAADAKVLVMDEPTSSLSLEETARLFEVVRALAARGVSVIYISHRLGEVEQLADRVLVLRDGRRAGELLRRDVCHDALVRLMVGRDVSRIVRRVPHTPGDPVLEVSRLVTGTHPGAEVSFAVRAGEIVGLAGLVGAGRSELLETVFGVRRARSGTVRVRGRPLRPGSPRRAVEAGLALVPEDRKEAGLLLSAPVRDNLALACLRRDARAGLLVDRTAERALARRQIDALGIRVAHDLVAAGTLSGGNQQKIVLGKWLARGPAALLLDEPTRGIDVGAKSEIWGLVDALAARGLAVLFASSEMEEVLAMADRVLVLHEGRLAGELPCDGLGEEAVMRLATGGERAA